MDDQAKTNLYAAVQSLNPDQEGFSLEEFMRAMSILETWNVHGKTVVTPGQEVSNIAAGSDGNQLLTNEDRVKLMIETGYAATKAHVDQIRNEVEAQRMELITERERIEAAQAELAAS